MIAIFQLHFVVVVVVVDKTQKKTETSFQRFNSGDCWAELHQKIGSRHNKGAGFHLKMMDLSDG